MPLFFPLRSWMPDSLPFSAAMQGMEGVHEHKILNIYLYIYD